MRDPERIDRMLAKVRTLWQQDPDLRLCQLLFNVANPRTPCPAFFYLEDDMLEERLDAALKEQPSS